MRFRSRNSLVAASLLAAAVLGSMASPVAALDRKAREEITDRIYRLPDHNHQPALQAMKLLEALGVLDIGPNAREKREKEVVQILDDLYKKHERGQAILSYYDHQYRYRTDQGDLAAVQAIVRANDLVLWDELMSIIPQLEQGLTALGAVPIGFASRVDRLDSRLKSLRQESLRYSIHLERFR